MKNKIFWLIVVLFFFAGFAVIANAGSVVPYTPDMIEGVRGGGSGHNLTSVRDEGNEVVLTISNVRLTPIGRDTKGRDLAMPRDVELYSAIMDAAGVKKPFVVAPVIDGTATFRIPNSAHMAGVPVVEHIWGRANGGDSMALVHDPNDPWVAYKIRNGHPNLNTLAIGLVMCPNGSTKPLKSLGKLDQGKHPELASYCQ